MSGAAAREPEDESPVPGRPLLLGLVGAGIRGRSPSRCTSGRVAACGLSLAYRPIDAERARVRRRATCPRCYLGHRLGFDGLNVTHPFKEAVVPLLDERSEDVAALGAANTVVIRDGHAAGYNTDWSGFARSLHRSLPDRPVHDRASWSARVAQAWPSATRLLHLGVGHVAVHDLDPARAAGCVGASPCASTPRPVVVVEDLAGALAAADGLVNATPTGMLGHPGLPVPAELSASGAVGRRHRLLPARHRARAARAGARLSRRTRRRHGRLPGGRSVRAASPAGRPTPNGCSSTSPRSRRRTRATG